MLVKINVMHDCAYLNTPIMYIHTHTHTPCSISQQETELAADEDEEAVSKTRFESVSQPAQTPEYKEQR